MVYTPEKPRRTESSEALRARIPGWGADLDPADRPAFPREQLDTSLRGDELPEQQPELWPRERSIEHGRLTPVFGTSSPPHGVSGVLRRYAYRRFSEARAAHWLILLGADRVDALESALASFLTLHPDNPVTETGVLSEVKRHGWSSRVGRNRADVRHQPLDPVIVLAPWVVGGAIGYRVVRSVRRRVRG